LEYHTETLPVDHVVNPVSGLTLLGNIVEDLVIHLLDTELIVDRFDPIMEDLYN